MALLAECFDVSDYLVKLQCEQDTVEHLFMTHEISRTGDFANWRVNET
jgi:hypothetical protein